MIRTRQTAAAVLIALCFVSAAHAQQAKLDSIDAYVVRTMSDWKIPGLALAIVKDDSVLMTKGYGVKEVGSSATVDEHTLFAIGSNTKPMTSTALGILVQEGLVSWDDPVTKHLTDFRLSDPWVTAEITIRDLLTHRSGLSKTDMMWYGFELEKEDLIRRLRLVELEYGFRSQMRYQNVHYLLVGQIIESVTGQSWEDFVDERLLKPLGMMSSGTRGIDPDLLENIATPHATIDDEIRAIPHRYDANMGPSGAVVSNARDMTRWLRLMLGRGMIDGDRLIDSTIVEEILMPQQLSVGLGDWVMTHYPSTHYITYSLGWGGRDYRGKLMIASAGWIDGMMSMVALVPEEGLGIALLTNREPSPTIPLIMRAIDTFLGAPPKDWSTDFLDRTNRDRVLQKENQEKRELARVDGTTPSLQLERYLGSYENDIFGSLTVSMDDDGLVLEFGPHYIGDLRHWNYDTFQVSWRDPRKGSRFLTFLVGPKGNVEKVNVERLADFEYVPGSGGRAEESP